VQAGLHVWWSQSELREAMLNGNRGLLQYEDGRPVAAVSFAYDEDGRLTDIFIVRNPDKLQRLHATRIA
jgi:RNA polymerase sigma-70 factor (ECF subfamily)